MIKIYELVDEDDVCLYVGRTKCPANREDSHRRRRSGCGTSDIPEDIYWWMNIIEECSVEEAKEREAYWIDQKAPLYNKDRPIERKRQKEIDAEAKRKKRQVEDFAKRFNGL
jgi:hypothetical protein